MPDAECVGTAPGPFTIALVWGDSETFVLRRVHIAVTELNRRITKAQTARVFDTRKRRNGDMKARRHFVTKAHMQKKKAIQI